MNANDMPTKLRGKRVTRYASAVEDVAVEQPKEEDTFIDEKDVIGGACYYDPKTGIRTCE